MHRSTRYLAALLAAALVACDRVKSLDRALLAGGRTQVALPSERDGLDPLAGAEPNPFASDADEPTPDWAQMMADPEPVPATEPEPEPEPAPPPARRAPRQPDTSGGDWPPAPPPPAAGWQEKLATTPAPAPSPLRATPTPVPARPAPPPPPPARVVPLLERDLPGGDPVPFAQVRSLFGKQLWATTAVQLRGRRSGGEVWVNAGEAVTLVKAEQYNNRPGQPLQWNFVTIRTQAGEEGEAQLRYFSSQPLRFDLSQPGKLEDLLRAAAEEALHQAVELHRLRVKHAWDVDSDATEDYHAQNSRDDAFKTARGVVRGLVHGTTSGEDLIMRQGSTRWAALADDARILPCWAHGMQDKAQRAQWEPLARLVNSLDNLDYHGYEIARLAREKQDKSWLRHMDGVPAAKLAALDERELKERDDEIADRRAKLEKALDDAAREVDQVLTPPG